MKNRVALKETKADARAHTRKGWSQLFKAFGWPGVTSFEREMAENAPGESVA